MEDTKTKELKTEEITMQDTLSKQVELSNLNLAILIRTEAVNIVTNILNAWIDAKQKTLSPVTKEELAAIQAQVNMENKITRDSYDKLENLLKENLK